MKYSENKIDKSDGIMTFRALHFLYDPRTFFISFIHTQYIQMHLKIQVNGQALWLAPSVWWSFHTFSHHFSIFFIYSVILSLEWTTLKWWKCLMFNGVYSPSHLRPFPLRFFHQNAIALHESNGIDIIVALLLIEIKSLGKNRIDLVLELKVNSNWTFAHILWYCGI